MSKNMPVYTCTSYEQHALVHYMYITHDQSLPPTLPRHIRNSY